MKRYLILLLLTATGWGMFSQTTERANTYANAVDDLLASDSRLLFGGYGEVHYNQPIQRNTRYNATLDVHRVVMLFGYNFSKKIQFVSEIEFEHVSEVYVEQAFLQYTFNETFKIRGGLLLIPMGIINEYHEPTAFNGVERPLIDKLIVPTTWREIGMGITGNIMPLNLKYQLYLVNGFNGYDGSGQLNGEYGLRKGRQKGAESFSSAPNLSGKVEYYGIRGLNIGLAGYMGNTESTAFDGIEKSDVSALARADSSVVGITMAGLDARYSYHGLRFRGQFYYTFLSNTEQYNDFTATDGVLNDLGSAMLGYYVEAGYNVFRFTRSPTQLIPFVRYEFLNTQSSVATQIVRNPDYAMQVVTAGVTWMIHQGAVVKGDLQWLQNESGEAPTTIFNVGIGVMF